MPASVLLYTLAPDKLLGWPRAPRDEERVFLGRHADLPVLGRLTGRDNTANVEVVLKSRPDLIVDYGVTTATYASLADRVQQQTGIPYVLLNGDFSSVPETSRLLGDLLGVPQRGQELGAHAERLLADTDRRVARVAPDRRRRVYYARGPRGPRRPPYAAPSTWRPWIGSARGTWPASAPHGGRLATVSMEQILRWNPEVVVTIDSAFAASVRAGPAVAERGGRPGGPRHLAPLVPFPGSIFPVGEPPDRPPVAGAHFLSRPVSGGSPRRDPGVLCALLSPDAR